MNLLPITLILMVMTIVQAVQMNQLRRLLEAYVKDALSREMSRNEAVVNGDITDEQLPTGMFRPTESDLIDYLEKKQMTNRKARRNPYEDWGILNG